MRLHGMRTIFTDDADFDDLSRVTRTPEGATNTYLYVWKPETVFERWPQ
jgi:hypothetical protein